MGIVSGTNLSYCSYLSNQWAYNIVYEQPKEQRWLCNPLLVRFSKLHTQVILGDYLGPKCVWEMKNFKFPKFGNCGSNSWVLINFKNISDHL
jgi:uncharacterized Tic20 family protein